jgi:hypothetical protein
MSFAWCFVSNVLYVLGVGIGAMGLDLGALVKIVDLGEWILRLGECLHWTVARVCLQWTVYIGLDLDLSRYRILPLGTA